MTVSLDSIPNTEHPDPPQRDQVPDEDSQKPRYYFEDYPAERKAGATWGNDQPLFVKIKREQEENGTSKWGPFKDQDEWKLAKWLSKNAGQKQTDEFLKLNIVSTYSLLRCHSLTEQQQTRNRTQPSYNSNRNFLKKIDALPTQVATWTWDTIASEGDWRNKDGKLMPPEQLELWLRDPIECLRELMGNPMFKDVLKYAPEKAYLDEDGNLHVYDEMWLPDWWWEIQVSKLVLRISRKERGTNFCNY